jgi:hypothetical protein
VRVTVTAPTPHRQALHAAPAAHAAPAHRQPRFDRCLRFLRKNQCINGVKAAAQSVRRISCTCSTCMGSKAQWQETELFVMRVLVKCQGENAGRCTSASPLGPARRTSCSRSTCRGTLWARRRTATSGEDVSGKGRERAYDWVTGQKGR